MNEPFELYSREIDADPFPGYARLRDEAPCYWSKDAGLWILSRYEDVVNAAQDWETFSSLQGNLIDEIPGRSGGTLGTTDPPHHDRLRSLAQAAFTRKAVEDLVPRTENIVDAAVDYVDGMDAFDFVAGYDSGFGAKPGPGQLQAACEYFGCAAGAAVMVGDSLHDLMAGRAAGMRTVGVLTGLAARAELSPLADAVLPDIGHLPGWLDGEARGPG